MEVFTRTSLGLSLAPVAMSSALISCPMGSHAGGADEASGIPRRRELGVTGASASRSAPPHARGGEAANALTGPLAVESRGASRGGGWSSAKGTGTMPAVCSIVRRFILLELRPLQHLVRATLCPVRWSGWWQRYGSARGSFLDPSLRPSSRENHLSKMFPLIKNESRGIERD